MEYEEIPRDTFVFEYGDIGHCMYIVLDGKVEVQLPNVQMRTELEQLLVEIKETKEKLDTLQSERSAIMAKKDSVISQKQAIDEHRKFNTGFLLE
jgi:hypothetical protein